MYICISLTTTNHSKNHTMRCYKIPFVNEEGTLILIMSNSFFKKILTGVKLAKSIVNRDKQKYDEAL